MEQKNQQVVEPQAEPENAMTKTVDELVDYAKKAEAATEAFVGMIRATAAKFVTEHLSTIEDPAEHADGFNLALSAVLTGCALEASRAIAVLSQGDADMRGRIIENFTNILRQESDAVALVLAKAAQKALDARNAELDNKPKQEVAEPEQATGTEGV